MIPFCPGCSAKKSGKLLFRHKMTQEAFANPATLAAAVFCAAHRVQVLDGDRHDTQKKELRFGAAIAGTVMVSCD